MVHFSLFPHVLIVDAEGNTDQCVNMPEIPQFLRVKTKNAREVMDVLDQVGAGKIKFPDGHLVETICIDSWSVLWGVGQEVAAKSAEKRAASKGYKVEDATPTQIDWVLAKRPLKRIMTRMSGLNARYLILICREKDPYNEDNNNKAEPVPDMVKGTDFEMNLVLHFGFEGMKWFYQTTKVQGALKELFPYMGKGYDFPMKELAKYALALKPDDKVDRDEEDVAKDMLSTETHGKTYDGLLAYAAALGYSKSRCGEIMRAAGFTTFKSNDWERMVEELDKLRKI